MTAAPRERHSRFHVGLPLRRSAEHTIRGLAERAGIQPNGPNPWDPWIGNPRFYEAVLRNPSLGLGETYMEHYWECERIDLLIERVLRAQVHRKLGSTLRLGIEVLLHRLINFQSVQRAAEVGEKHYDIGEDLYAAMLDSAMNYSCGYWKEANDLEQAQQHKMALIAAKLDLRPGQRVLDIGCGWGGMARHLATHHGVEVVGITISARQCEYARAASGTSGNTEFRLQDYRDVNEPFDRIVSIGMFEHVGYKNYAAFFDAIVRNLKADGLVLLHSIFGNRTGFRGDPWLEKYIFPNGMLPSIQQFGKASEGRLIPEDMQNLGPDYHRTLLAWNHNFERTKGCLPSRYDERFKRMWRYYLLSCAGAFLARHIQLHQWVLSKERGARYDAPR